MGRSEGYEKRTEEFLDSISGDMQFEVVDVEFIKEAGTYYLRAYCDKDGGIGVDDCADISRRLSDWLDKEDFIDESYILEVSSPGLGRQLKKDKDFKRALGQKVELKLYKAIEKTKEFEGTLASYDSDSVEIQTEETTYTFKRSDIAIIRMAIDF